jgi:type III secretory pathway component EscV
LFFDSENKVTKRLTNKISINNQTLIVERQWLVCYFVNIVFISNFNIMKKVFLSVALLGLVAMGTVNAQDQDNKKKDQTKTEQPADLKKDELKNQDPNTKQQEMSNDEKQKAEQSQKAFDPNQQPQDAAPKTDTATQPQ